MWRLRGLIDNINMFRIGTGYNPGFTYQPGHPSCLELPPVSTLVELGIQELNTWGRNYQDDSWHFSLHIARSPINEKYTQQKRFIENVLKPFKNIPLLSIGLHLTGPRNANIGKYGFSSYLDPQYHNHYSIDFIKRVEDLFGIEVWIENSNFYSRDLRAPLKIWESIGEICERTNSKIIVDLAHLLVDCWNVGLSPDVALGFIPWNHVKEIHLSGIVQGKDGAYHDGHASPVHEVEWRMLDGIFTYLLPIDSDIFVTIEHTDMEWTDKKEDFYAEFSRLEKFREDIAHKQKQVPLAYKNSEQYSQNRLKKLLEKRDPQIRILSERLGTLYDEAFTSWISGILEKKSARLVFTECELLDNEEDIEVILSKESFKNFLEKNINAIKEIK